MADAILVLNAGSSSLKFSVFLNGEPPELFRHGQIEGLFTQPHFIARDQTGGVVAEKEWPAGTKLGHGGAIEFLFEWGHGKLGRTSHYRRRPPGRTRGTKVHAASHCRR